MTIQFRLDSWPGQHSDELTERSVFGDVELLHFGICFENAFEDAILKAQHVTALPLGQWFTAHDDASSNRRATASATAPER